MPSLRVRIAQVKLCRRAAAYRANNACTLASERDELRLKCAALEEETEALARENYAIRQTSVPKEQYDAAAEQVRKLVAELDEAKAKLAIPLVERFDIEPYSDFSAK